MEGSFSLTEYNLESKLTVLKPALKGEKIGEKQSKIEIAKKMLGKYPVEEIHELTGLDIEEIEKL